LRRRPRWGGPLRRRPARCLSSRSAKTILHTRPWPYGMKRHFPPRGRESSRPRNSGARFHFHGTSKGAESGPVVPDSTSTGPARVLKWTSGARFHFRGTSKGASVDQWCQIPLPRGPVRPRGDGETEYGGQRINEQVHAHYEQFMEVEAAVRDLRTTPRCSPEQRSPPEQRRARATAPPEQRSPPEQRRARATAPPEQRRPRATVAPGATAPPEQRSPPEQQRPQERQRPRLRPGSPPLPSGKWAPGRSTSTWACGRCRRPARAG
jgi:hypothetical protein